MISLHLKEPNILKQLLQLLLLLLPLGAMTQVSTVLTNPSACGLNEPLSDFNCPENSNFYNPDIFEIQVTNAPGTALGTDVYLKEVKLLVEHPWVSDMNFALRSPSGIVANLIGNIGGNGDNFGDTSLVDCSGAMVFALAACDLLSDGTPPFADVPYRAIEDFYIFNDGTTNPNASWELLICDDLNDDTGILQYVELVFAPLACLPIQDVSLLSQDTTTAIFTYAPEANCGPAVVEIGPRGFTPGTNATPGQGEIFFVGCPPFTLTDLNEDTEYDIYLRRSCPGMATYSANSCVSYFRTGCDPAPVSGLENFDAQLNCSSFCGTNCELTGSWQNIEGDDFDWLTNNGPTPTLFGTGPMDDITGGGNYVYLEANGSQCAVGAKAYLHSSCLILNKQGSDSCHLSFNYHMSGINTGSLAVEASEDGGFNWSEIWQRNGQQDTGWQKAYIGLGDYPDGADLQLRIAGIKGNGIYGDIALDQIQLHGSEVVGFPSNKLYADTDGDGFGEAGSIGLLTCLAVAPSNYAFNNLDCNDEDETIFPGAQEITCNGIDENCNAATIDDDSILPPPPTGNDTICSGETPLLIAESDPDFQVFWYASADRSGGLLWVGNTFSPNVPVNTTAFSQTHNFYAEVTNFTCSSPVLGVATVMVLPLPSGNVVTAAEVCPGTEVDLASTDIQDQNFTGATISYHSASPASATNELPDTRVTPSQAASYTYLMTSPDGCQFEDQLPVSLKEIPQINFLPADSFSLCRELSDTVIASANGGTGGYSYLWENGRSGPVFPVQGAGMAGVLTAYELSVTDSEGCIAVDSFLLQTTNSIDSIRLFSTPVSSCEGADGTITVIPLNGLPPFSYQWEDAEGNTGTGANIADTVFITSLPQSAYRVTVTDDSAEGCQVLLRNIRIQGPGFELAETTLNSPSCAGFTDGSICLEVTGSANISYTWSDGQLTACAENLTAGEYSVTITNGECTTIEVYSLLQPDSLILSVQSTTPTCNESTDGELEVLAFGGTPDYTYQWGNGFLGPRIPNITEGDYTLDLTDGNGCLLRDTFVLLAPEPLDVLVDSLANITCVGLNDGLIRVSGTGGTPPYRYEWGNGSTVPLRLDLTPGNYSLTITDFNDCSMSTIIPIEEPAPLGLDVVSITAPVCDGDDTGSITTGATGGVMPYTLLWSDGAETMSFTSRSNLPVGIYTIVLKDANGCESDSLTIDLLPQSNLDITANLTEPTCVGLTDGAIQITASGIAPQTYAWSNSAVGPNLTNIGVGDYALSVTDARGCIADTIINLTADQVFSLNSTVVQPSCFGVNDGIIDQTLIEQGLPPFQFFWTDNTQHVDQMFLEPGEYQYTVSDAIGCTFISDTFRMEYPEVLSLDVIESDGISCFGDETGFFETTAVGGTTPYTYNWVGTGTTTSNIYNLTAGDHRLSVTDARGCALDTILLLANPAPLTIDASLENGDVCDPNDPDVLVSTVLGGMMPYVYEWTTREETASIVDPEPGDYFLTVTDANGCEAVFGTIKVQEGIPPLMLDSFVVQQVSCFEGEDASLLAYTSGGSERLRYHFTPTFILETDTNIVQIGELAYDDNYSVTVTDMETGCEVASSEISGVQPTPIAIQRDSFSVVNCFGGADGSVHVSVTGGTGDYEYLWTNEAGDFISNQQDLNFAQAQIYQLLVTDENNCTAIYGDSNVVVINELIVMTDTFITDVACRGEATGAIDVTIEGGVGPYIYQWSNDEETQQIENLTIGIYTLTVTDSDTCRVIFPGISISQPATEIFLSDTIHPVSCVGEMDGRIALAVSGGIPSYSYVWRRNGVLIPTLSGPIIENLIAADYELMLTDQNDCTQEYLFPVLDPPTLLVEIQNQPIGADSLRVIPGGGNPPYTYLWSTNETTEVINGLSSNFYEVQVMDTNGCIVSTNYQLTNTHNLAEAQSIRAFPNPTTGIVQLEFLAEIPDAGTPVQLFDQLGRNIAQWKTQGASSILKIDLSPFPVGYYVLRVGNISFLEIIKQK